MNRSVTTWQWGPAAVATLIIFAAISVGAGAGLGLVWMCVTYDFADLAHTLVLAAILADLAVMAWLCKRLLRAYRRQP